MRYDLITTFLVYMFPVTSSLGYRVQRHSYKIIATAAFGPNISNLFDLSLIRLKIVGK